MDVRTVKRRIKKLFDLDFIGKDTVLRYDNGQRSNQRFMTIITDKIQSEIQHNERSLASENLAKNAGDKNAHLKTEHSNTALNQGSNSTDASDKNAKSRGHNVPIKDKVKDNIKYNLFNSCYNNLVSYPSDNNKKDFLPVVSNSHEKEFTEIEVSNESYAEDCNIIGNIDDETSSILDNMFDCEDNSAYSERDIIYGCQPLVFPDEEDMWAELDREQARLNNCQNNFDDFIA